MVTFEAVQQVIGDVLHLGERTAQLNRTTALMGSFPEFDSMAVVTLLAALEERFGILVEDDEISADTFATVGSVYDFVLRKVAA